MHILILPSWYPSKINPVAGIFFKEQAEALERAGLDVGVVYPEQRSVKTLAKGHLSEYRFQYSWKRENNIPVFRHHGWNFPKLKDLNRILWNHFLRKLFRDYISIFGKPDILHAHSAVWAGVGAKALAAEFQIPYLITEHYSAFQQGVILDKRKQLIQRAYRDAETVLTVSKALAKAIHPFLYDRSAVIVPNIVNALFFDNPRQYTEKSKGFKFLVVAILSKKKGIDNLLRAFAMSFKGDSTIELEIGGDGEARLHLEALSKELKIDGQVTFLGSLSRQGVVEAMHRSNAFVLPSYSETFGVVLIEAMAAGLPVIATRSGGPEDFVTPDVGILTTPGNVPELAAALQSIYREREYWSGRHIEISNYVRDRFSEKRVVSQLKRIYTKILAKT